jgi:hypothetical protein
MRRAAGIVALALLLAGCGSKHVAPTAQRAQVRATVASLLHDFAAGNGQAVCARLTTAGETSLIKTVGPELVNFGITRCDQVVHVTATQLSAQVRNELRHATVGAVALQGGKATVEWSEIRSPEGDLGAFFGHPRPVMLLAVNGVWLVSAL